MRGDRGRGEHQRRQCRFVICRVIIVFVGLCRLDAVPEAVELVLGCREGQGEYHVAFVECSGADPADAHVSHAHELRAVREVHAVLTQPDCQRCDLVRAALALSHGAQGTERLRGQRVGGVRVSRGTAAVLMFGRRRAVDHLGSRGGAHVKTSERRSSVRRVGFVSFGIRRSGAADRTPRRVVAPRDERP